MVRTTEPAMLRLQSAQPLLGGGSRLRPESPTRNGVKLDRVFCGEQYRHDIAIHRHIQTVKALKVHFPKEMAFEQTAQ
jgi:hypothetical protein